VQRKFTTYLFADDAKLFNTFGRPKENAENADTTNYGCDADANTGD